MSAILREAEALCRACAPHELRGAPLYIVRKNDLPEERRGHPAFTAWTSPVLDLELRDVIGARWHGRGPAMVVSDQQEGWAVLGSALHELGHVLDRTALYGELPAGVAVEERAGANTAHLARVHPVAVQVAAHPVSWVRLCLHLAHRAQQTGIAEAPSFELLAYRFLVPVLLTMARVLHDELVAWERRPLAELKTTPVPADLTDLYQTAVRLANLEREGAA